MRHQEKIKTTALLLFLAPIFVGIGLKAMELSWIRGGHWDYLFLSGILPFAFGMLLFGLALNYILFEGK